MEGSGFEPPNPKERIYSPPRLARLRYPSKMARDGIEPPTHAASMHCSTDWATEPLTVPAGIEPAISCVTGRRPNQLDQGTRFNFFKTNCGSRIWTYDLRVMSPTSYQTAPSRDNKNITCYPLRRMWDSNPRAAFATWRFSRPFP